MNVVHTVYEYAKNSSKKHLRTNYGPTHPELSMPIELARKLREYILAKGLGELHRTTSDSDASPVILNSFGLGFDIKRTYIHQIEKDFKSHLNETRELNPKNLDASLKQMQLETIPKSERRSRRAFRFSIGISIITILITATTLYFNFKKVSKLEKENAQLHLRLHTHLVTERTSHPYIDNRLDNIELVINNMLKRESTPHPNP